MEIQKAPPKCLPYAKTWRGRCPEGGSGMRAQSLVERISAKNEEQPHCARPVLQLFPATNALQAMALGKVAGSGGQPEYYEYIGNPESRPVFCLSPLEPDLKERLAAFASDPSPLFEMSRESRKLVETHNDVRKVADRFVAHWEKPQIIRASSPENLL